MSIVAHPVSPRPAPSAQAALLAAASGAALGIALVLDVTAGIFVAVAIAVACITTVQPVAIATVLAVSVFVESIALEGVTISRLLAPLALVVVGMQLLRGKAHVHLAAPLVWVVAYSIWALASGFWTVSTSTTLTLLASLAIAIVYMVTFAAMLSSERQLRQLLLGLAAASCVAGAASIAAFGGLPVVGSLLTTSRAQGGVGDPNFFAHLQVMAFPIVLVLANEAQSRWRRWSLVFATFVTMASVFVTLSRGGMIALAVITLLLVLMPAHGLFRTPQQKATMLLVLAAGTLVLFSRPGFRSEVVSRVETLVSPSAEPTGAEAGSGRTEIWKAARATFSDHVVTGVGFGGFRVVSNDRLMQTPGVDVDKVSNHPHGIEAHSAYLGTAAELGVVGLTLFVAMVAATFVHLRRTAARARRAGAGFISRVAQALSLSIIGWTVCSFFLETETSRPIWIVIGLSLVLPKLIPAVRPALPVSPPSRWLLRSWPE